MGLGDWGTVQPPTIQGPDEAGVWSPQPFPSQRVIPADASRKRKQCPTHDPTGDLIGAVGKEEECTGQTEMQANQSFWKGAQSEPEPELRHV